MTILEDLVWRGDNDMKKTVLLIIPLLFLFVSCEDEQEKDSTGSSNENTTTVVGFWFACEFGSSNDCMILDDDGYQFTTEGEIYDIEEATQGSEPECGQSPCFRADQKSLTVNRGLIGTYTYDDTSVTIALDPNVRPACTENVIWNTSVDFFETQSSCLPFESTHVKRYTGVVTIN